MISMGFPLGFVCLRVGSYTPTKLLVKEEGKEENEEEANSRHTSLPKTCQGPRLLALEGSLIFT